VFGKQLFQTAVLPQTALFQKAIPNSLLGIAFY